MTDPNTANRPATPEDIESLEAKQEALMRERMRRETLSTYMQVRLHVATQLLAGAYADDTVPGPRFPTYCQDIIRAADALIEANNAVEPSKVLFQPVPNDLDPSSDEEQEPGTDEDDQVEQ